MIALNNSTSRHIGWREKFLKIALSAALLVAFLIKLDGVSTLEVIRELYLEQSLIRAELEPLDAVIAGEQQITASYLESKTDRLRLEKLIPRAEQHPAAVAELEKLINSGSGRLMAMRISEKVDCGNYSTRNINIKIGSLNTFPGDLIRQLEDFPQYLIIEQIEWSTENAESGTIFISLNLCFLN